jgi:peptidoglycan/xylan/chitin deacetylase (PgdA/CDA1 family)
MIDDEQRTRTGTGEASETGLGPDRRSRAIVLTFDNLGEASALERGTSRPQTPLGRDPSVTRALPRLLDELDHSALTATFFVEAINCELNPQALGEIVARGHELGVHGWRHEQWGGLEPEAERELLQRSTAAFAALGLEARGFRPPGGELTAHTPELLSQLDYTWCSPAAGTGAVGDGLASVPFSWELVDAYHLMERFADLRVSRGDGPDPVAPTVLADRLAAELATGGDGGVQTLVLHPFLMLDEAWFAGVRRLLALVAELARTGHAWVVPGGRLVAGS